MDAVEFENVSRFYGQRAAICEANFSIPAGTLFGLLGPNGAGKSTCLNMVTTLLEPSAGRVRVGGFNVVEESAKVRCMVGYAPEEPLIYSGLTAREFVELSARLHGLDATSAAASTCVVLAELELDERADDVVISFSKGMRRKALLCAALVHDPKILVLDEPLEGLDVIAQARLQALLQARVARGLTVLYSTHSIEIVENICTHVALLGEGRLLASGPVVEVKRQLGVERLIDVFLGGALSHSGSAERASGERS